SQTGDHCLALLASADCELRLPHLPPADLFTPSTSDLSKETSRLIGSCSTKMPS
ncbi:hypothetical protein FIBSPDRAFT_874248, partial [Athelia psychrophila]